MEKRKTQTKSTRKAKPKTGSAKSSGKRNSGRSRIRHETELVPEEVQRVYHHESRQLKEEPYTLRWYTNERDIELDEAQEKRNA